MKWYAKTDLGAMLGFSYLPTVVLTFYSSHDSYSRAHSTVFTLD